MFAIMSRKYNPTDSLIYKNIDLDSDRRIVFLSGYGIEIRKQREGFVRRFALNSGVSYLALDYTKYLESDPKNMDTVFTKTMEILSNLSPKERLFLCGPCLGGMMALRTASKIPERVGGVIAIAPAYETPEFLWIEKADQFLEQRITRLERKKADKKIIQKMIAFRQVVIGVFKRHAREKIESTYQGPIALFHGQKDNLIPVENLKYVQADLKNTNTFSYVIPNGSHTLNNDFEMRAQIRVLKEQLGYCKSTLS